MESGHGALAHQAKDKDLPKNRGATRYRGVDKAGSLGKFIALLERMVGEGGQKAGTSKSRRDLERARREAVMQKMIANREKIARAVKDAMLVAEMLSGSYRFKVLSHRLGGDRFSVLMDMSVPMPGGVSQQKETEALIARLSQSRWGLEVVSVYWRISETVPKKPSQKPVRASRDNDAREGLLSDTDFGDLPGMH